MKEVGCPICEINNHKLILQVKDYRFHVTNLDFNLVQCQQCGLIYLYPIPSKNEIDKYYPKNYHKKLYSRTEKIIVEIFHIIKVRKITRFKKNGRILDIGCGDGGFLLNFKKRGWDVYGIDISRNAYRMAKEKLGQNVFNCELKKCNFPNGYFDVITLNHVLEHVPDPNEMLKEIHRILKKNGILFLSVPNINSLQFKICKDHWIHLDPPRHLYHYSNKTIELLLKKNGFKKTLLYYPLLDFPMDLFSSMLSCLTSKRRKIIRLVIAPFLLPISLFLKLFPAFRASMAVIAQKLHSRDDELWALKEQ